MSAASPAHDTLNDVVNGLDPELSKANFASWVEGVRDGEPDIGALDGKTSRRTQDWGRGREPVHLVSAWASRQRLVLGQEAMDAKSNEITAIPLLLQRLQLQGALVPSMPSAPRPTSQRPSSPAVAPIYWP